MLNKQAILMMESIRQSRSATLIIKAALPSLYAFTFSPSLPAIAKQFTLKFFDAGLLIIVFFLGSALGFFLYVSLLELYPKKVFKIGGLLLIFLGSTLCALAGHTNQFLLFLSARFAIGIGCSLGFSSALFAAIACYSQTEIFRFFSLFLLTSALLSAFATLACGLLAGMYGWQSSFYFLAGTALLLLLLLSLPSARKKTKPFPSAKIAPSFWIVSIMGCCLSIYSLFICSAPFIGIHLTGLDTMHYSGWMLIPYLGAILAALSIEYAHKWFSLQQLLSLGGKILFATALLYVGVFYFGYMSPWSLFFPMLCIHAGLVFVGAAAGALAYKERATASFHLLAYALAGCLCLSSLLLFTAVFIQKPLTFFLFFLTLLFATSYLTRFLRVKNSAYALKTEI